MLALVFLFCASVWHFYGALSDSEKLDSISEVVLKPHHSRYTAQALLIELDDMHNESDFAIQCERHTLWKDKVLSYVNNIEAEQTSVRGDNVIQYPMQKRVR